ncbi:MAG: hypothetical protein ACR2KV_15890 [Solirubrobacteraceae bacterium]
MPWRYETRRQTSRRRRTAARTVGRVGIVLGPLALLTGSAPAGTAAGTGHPARAHRIRGWNEAATRWMTPALGGLAPAALLPPLPQPSITASGRLIRAMFLAGDRIARLPYKWGGGHGSFTDDGYDCSGSVSYVLHAAGLLAAPEASGALTAYGEPGPGRRVTVYANPQHVLVSVDGRRFDTIALQQTGTRWAPQVGSVDGYVIRHPAGL